MQMRHVIAAATVALVATLAGAQSNVYRWVDKDGKVHFSDTPPPADAKSASQKRMGGGYVETENLPYATQMAMKKSPVTLFVGSDCGEPCANGRDLLAKRGVTMGVFVIDGGDNWKVSLATGKPEFTEVFVKACRDAVDVAKRVNAKWMTVVPGYFERNLPIGIQTGNVIDALKKGADILAPHNLTMVLEPLSDNPDLFLRTSDQGYMVCRAVGSPACKILFDMYHQQITEGNIIPNIGLNWDEIAYFQIGDNPGRNEPGTGEMNYQGIFRHIRSKGYQGVLGMEHGNSKPDKAGEQAVIDAYVAADS